LEFRKRKNAPKVDQISEDIMPDVQQNALELVKHSLTNLVLNLEQNSIIHNIDLESLLSIANKFRTPDPVVKQPVL